MSGNLTVNPRSARLTRDTDFFSKMDPYCVLRMGGQKVQTKVASGAGKTPIWNEQFTLRRNPGDDIVNVEVWDQDSMTKNDLVGEGSFAVTSVNSGGRSSQTVVLSYKGKKAGEVTVDIEFFPDSKNSSSAQPQFGVAGGMPMGFMPIPQFAFQMAGIPVQTYVPPVYPGYQQPGVGFPSPMGFSQAPAMGYQPPATSVYPGFQPPAGGYQQPPGGYQQPPAGGYQQPPAGGYQQAPAGGYQQPPAGGYQQPPAGGYQQPPAGGYQQPPSGGYQQPPAGGYQQPPAGGYQQPPAGGYQQPPSGGYQQQPTAASQQSQYGQQPSWGGGAPAYK